MRKTSYAAAIAEALRISLAEDPRVSLVGRGHPRHEDGLTVVGDHPLHELDIRFSVPGPTGDDDGGLAGHPFHRVLSVSGGGEREGQRQGCQRRD